MMTSGMRIRTIYILLLFVLSAAIVAGVTMCDAHNSVSDLVASIGGGAAIACLVFGFWFLARLLSAIKTMHCALDPLRRAVLVATVTFLLCIICALPKVYKIETRSSRSKVHKETRTVIAPIWHPPEVAKSKVSFTGLSFSVMTCELLGSIALGLLVWAFSKSKTPRNTEPTDQHAAEGPP